MNGKPARPRDAVFGGEKVTVQARPVADDRVMPERMPIKVLYRDSHVFVIDKPAGLVVHPGAGNRSRTLQNGLLALDPELARVPRAGIVHRIDKDTSGLLVVARTPGSPHGAGGARWPSTTVAREYVALCVGAMTGGGTVDKAIDRHRTDRLRMTVRADGRAGHHALPPGRALRASQPAARDSGNRPHAPDPCAPGACRASAGG